MEATMDCIAELFRRVPPGKCANCLAHAPGIRKEGYSKLFLQPLSAKKLAQNQMRKVGILDAIHGDAEVRRCQMLVAVGASVLGCKRVATMR